MGGLDLEFSDENVPEGRTLRTDFHLLQKELIILQYEQSIFSINKVLSCVF